MMGGFQEVEITDDHRMILTGNQAAICEKLGLEGTPELKIEKVQEQIVAGKFIWFHLSSEGNPYSACVFQGLDGAFENLEVHIGEAGHTEARNPNSWS